MTRKTQQRQTCSRQSTLATRQLLRKLQWSRSWAATVTRNRARKIHKQWGGGNYAENKLWLGKRKKKNSHWSRPLAVAELALQLPFLALLARPGTIASNLRTQTFATVSTVSTAVSQSTNHKRK